MELVVTLKRKAAQEPPKEVRSKSECGGSRGCASLLGGNNVTTGELLSKPAWPHTSPSGLAANPYRQWNDGGWWEPGCER